MKKIKNYIYRFFILLAIVIMFINNFIRFINYDDNLETLIYGCISVYSFILLYSELISTFKQKKYEIDNLKLIILEKEKIIDEKEKIINSLIDKIK